MILAFAIATIDYLRHKQTWIKHNEFQLSQIEENVIDAITTVEKAYSLFDQQTVSKMEENTEELIRLYEETSSFDDWDFAALREEMNNDIYIINEQNVITHSSLSSDIGMDFAECCASLSEILNERRDSGEFFVDRMDMEQETGMIRMYSYMATPDRKHIIQLGYNLQDDEIFEEFNFLNVIDQQMEKYPSVNEINVVNIGGNVLGKSVEELNLTEERREANKEALSTHEIVEFKNNWKNKMAIYRYIPYASPYDTGSSGEKTVEIIYDDSDFQATLNSNRNSFFIQLSTVSIVILVVSLLIHTWVSRQVYFAYHDSLTDLKNRAAFDDFLGNILSKNKKDKNKTTALMMIDLDNFKPVNDYLGHDRGDYLLQLIGQTIKQTIGEKDEAFRVGGDEFCVVMPHTNQEEAVQFANRIIEQLKASTTNEQDLDNFDITASIGISFAPDHGMDHDTLYKKADIALYHAKEKGKSQCSIYHDGLLSGGRTNMNDSNVQKI